MKPSIEISQKTSNTLELCGEWTSYYWPHIQELQARAPLTGSPELFINGSKILALDTIGAYGICQLIQKFQEHNKSIKLKDFSKHFLERVQALMPLSQIQPENHQPPKDLINLIENIGRTTEANILQGVSHLSFLGKVTFNLWDTFKNPSRFRVKSFYKYLYETGYLALPIVGLISFLIGVVLVYQGANQLERFGAAIFTVNLLSVSILRELGILLTAIVLAGRSGSSFTAQIGYMKLNQELDAMAVMNLNPLDLLILPRILALVVGLPLLTIYSDMMGLLGGAIMSMNLIDLSLTQFLQQLKLSIGPWTFWVGLIKAPFFAFVIAFVGCYEGLSVVGGAEEVGRRTTLSVVKSIFLVIVLDAAFSILFSELGI